MANYVDKENIIQICTKIGMDFKKFMADNKLTSLDQLPFCFGIRNAEDNVECGEKECGTAKACQAVTDILLAGEDTDLKERVFLRFRTLAKVADASADDEVIDEELAKVEAKIVKPKKALARGVISKKVEVKKPEPKVEDEFEAVATEDDEFESVGSDDEFEAVAEEVAAEIPEEKATKKPDMDTIDFDAPDNVEISEKPLPEAKPKKKKEAKVVEKINQDFLFADGKLASEDPKKETEAAEPAFEEDFDVIAGVGATAKIVTSMKFDSSELQRQAVAEEVKAEEPTQLTGGSLSLLPFNKKGYKILVQRDDNGDTLFTVTPILDCTCTISAAPKTDKPVPVGGSLFPAIRAFIETQSIDRNFSFSKVFKYLEKENILYKIEHVESALKSMSDIVINTEKQMARRKA
jgi:hypothetical protein